MGRRETVLDLLQRVNDRDFDGVRDLHTVDAHYFAPGIDVDLHGRDAIVHEITKAVEQGELRYDVHDVFQQGPFVVAFARAVGMIDGFPMGWELCGVYRFDGDRIAETWVMRGAPPQPDA